MQGSIVVFPDIDLYASSLIAYRIRISDTCLLVDYPVNIMNGSIKSIGRRHPAAAEEWQMEARLTESYGLPKNSISSSTQSLLAASAERRRDPILAGLQLSAA